MKVVVLSCAKYSDAWTPFFTLFRRFWPDCPYPLWLVTDNTDGFFSPLEASPSHVFRYESPSWNKILVEFCAQHEDEPIMLFLEDYFLTSMVRTDRVRFCLGEFYKQDAACVRLYPCPGADEDYGDPHLARISSDASYRISTQVALWNPLYLKKYANRTTSPWEFEIKGTSMSRYDVRPYLGWKRHVQPWPLEYICTAIVRGVWQQGALDFCRQQGIPVDTSRRPIQTV
jgi:hypothetical protein